jgi:hypothetical protein
MRIGDVLFFAPNHRFADLNFGDSTSLIEAFKARVEGFYIGPARKLVDADDAFAAGVICVALIDFIARYSSGKQEVGARFTSWLEDNIAEFKEKDPLDPSRSLGRRFYDDFRNGLVHEGRIKNLGQFSKDFPELYHLIDGGMVVNPAHLIQRTGEAVSRYCERLRKEVPEFEKLSLRLRQDFQAEINAR